MNIKTKTIIPQTNPVVWLHSAYPLHGWNWNAKIITIGFWMNLRSWNIWKHIIEWLIIIKYSFEERKIEQVLWFPSPKILWIIGNAVWQEDLLHAYTVTTLKTKKGSPLLETCNKIWWNLSKDLLLLSTADC